MAAETRNSSPDCPVARLARTLLPLALLVFTTSAHAEDVPGGWLPVSATELSLKDSRIEPGADAEILFSKTWVEDTYSDHLTSNRDHYLRLKVYTAAGAQSYSKIDIDYALRDVHVSEVRARVVQPGGATSETNRRSIVEATLVKQRGKGLRRTSIPLPNVTVGCIIEYRYHELLTDHAAFVQTYDLQFDVPARSIAYFIKPLVVEGVFPRQTLFHSTARIDSRGEDGYYPLVTTNQPPYVREPDSPPEYQTRAWMLMYYTNQALKSPEVFWHEFSKEQGKWAEEFSRPNKTVRELAATVTAKAGDDASKIQALNEWMRLNFRVLGSTVKDSLKAAGIHANVDARDALRQKAGGGHDAELALVALARGAGLDARLLRVPERSELFFDANMMDEGFVPAFDAGIRLNGHWRGFDIESRYLPWDMLPWSEEDQPAVFCDTDSGGFITLEPSGPERSMIERKWSLELSEDGALEGDFHASTSGHFNDSFRSALEDAAGAQVDSVLLDESDWSARSIQISNVTLDRGAHDWDPLQMNFHVRMPEHAMVTGKRMILQPSAMTAHVPARFTASSRRTPIVFRHAWAELDTVRIRLPEGWRVEELESSLPLVAKGVATYKSTTTLGNHGKELTYVRSLVAGMDGTIAFPVESYPDLKKLFDLIHDRDQSSVTLVREDAK